MIKRFKNGNMNCHIDNDAYDARLDVLGNFMSDLHDCQQLSDPYCVGNFEMAIDFYSAYTGKNIHLCFQDLKAGKLEKH